VHLISVVTWLSPIDIKGDPFAHAVVPDRRRKLLTTLVAFALPVYLALGNSVFDWRLRRGHLRLP
jgi:hypothetical protein